MRTTTISPSNLLFAIFASAMIATGPANAEGLPTLDRFMESKAQIALPHNQVNVSHIEPRHGVPSFFFAKATLGLTPKSLGLSPEAAARQHLAAHAALYRTDADRLSAAELEHLHDTGQGAIIATFTAKVSGLPVFRASLKVIMNRAYALVAMSGYLAPQALNAEPQQTHELSEVAALSIAVQDRFGAMMQPGDFVNLGQRAGYRRYALPQDLLARARRVYFDAADALLPSYHLELGGYTYVVSAVDGALLFRNSLLSKDHSYRVFADATSPHRPYDNPLADATPHPVGAPAPLELATRESKLLSLGFGPIQNGDPWLPESATETRGNNVDAYADLAAPDGFGPSDLRGMAPDGRSFGHSYEPSAHPQESESQIQAAITNLFYVTNYLHDEFYDLGFDERSGNAQNNNFSRGGLGGDRLLAEAMDASGFNNANMLTPADGGSPRMQMYIFSGRQKARLFLHHDNKQLEEPYVSYAFFGPRDFSVNGTLVRVLDSNNSEGCSFPFDNGDDLGGQVAFLRRGGCPFIDKVQNAQDHGAIAAIIMDDEERALPPNLDGFSASIVIPAVSIRMNDGVRLLEALGGGSGIDASLLGHAPAPQDSSLDNTLIAHEWGHYISNRLIGDGSGLSNAQGRAMGEGWADFHALLLSLRAGDQPSGAYAVGGYSTVEPYFGLRRVPYSTDLSKNALTLRHIESGVALPNVPTAFGETGQDNSAPHSTGEVWATMLFECYAALLQAPHLTFSQARDRMMRYLVAAYKSTPVTPNILEGRDALLAVALAHDRADFNLFKTAFAKRGAGLGARAPDRFSGNNAGVLESFAEGNALSFVSVYVDDGTGLYCDNDGWLDSGEVGRVVVEVKNTGWGDLRNSSIWVTSTDPNIDFADGPEASLASTQPGETATAELWFSLSGTPQMRTSQIRVELSDPELTQNPPSMLHSFEVNLDVLQNQEFIDDVESIATVWTPTQSGEAAPFNRIREASNYEWRAQSAGSTSDRYLISPPMLVRPDVDLELEFEHRYFLETDYDGAVVELSVDRGATWIDIGDSLTGGYPGLISGNDGSPIAGQKAFTGMSPNFPSFHRVGTNLGRDFADEVVQVRFRIATDPLVSWWGWSIDNIRFTGVDDPPFPKSIDDRARCVNRPPIAVTDGVLDVLEGETVPLNASRSGDLDQDPMTFTWRQLEGPTVQIVEADTLDASGRFIAPEVSSDSVLILELTASDGQLDSRPALLTVNVQNVNKAPSVSTGGDLMARINGRVELFGRGQDPEGDPLSYSWRQLSGPRVDLHAADTETPWFFAPLAPKNTKLSFELIASDGAADSAPATQQVIIFEQNQTPIVLPIETRVVTPGEGVELRAQAMDPDGDALSFTWSKERGANIFFEADGAQLRFIAPTQLGELNFFLTVSDGLSSSPPTRVTVMVRPPAPLSIMLPAEVRVPEGERVYIEAKVRTQIASSVLHQWRQLEGLSVSLTPGKDLRFVAPRVRQDQVLRFQLTVRTEDPISGEQHEAISEIRVVVEQRNEAPNVSAGRSRVVRPGEIVVLHGTVERLEDEASEQLLFRWEQTAGPRVELSPIDAQAPSFVAPTLDSEAILAFVLTVSDGERSASSATEIVVEAAPKGCTCAKRPGRSWPSGLLLGLLPFIAVLRRNADQFLKGR